MTFRKLQKDNQGISGLNILIILAITGLIFWQYAIPIIQPGQMSFTDFIQTGGQEINVNWGVLNKNDGIIVMAGESAVSYYDYDDNYSIILKSNVPYKMTNPYSVSVKVIESGIIIGGFYENIPINAIFSDEFKFNLNLDTLQNLDYEIQLTVYDYNENAVPSPYNLYIHDRI